MDARLADTGLLDQCRHVEAADVSREFSETLSVVFNKSVVDLVAC